MSKVKILSISPFSQNVNDQAHKFYNAIIDAAGGRPNFSIILVVPGYESSLPLIQSLHEKVDLCGIIIKNSTKSRNIAFEACLKNAGYPVLDIAKEDMKAGSVKSISLLDDIFSKKDGVAVMDHGGYFAQNEKVLQSFPPNKICGVAEYTLNGELRYAFSNVNDRPIISVGQSDLKVASDHAASDAIVCVSDLFTRRGGLVLTSQANKIGVIGHGRLGSRIAERLKLAGADDIQIYDNNAAKLFNLNAKNIASSKFKLLEQCNILFCATGNRALTATDFHYINDKSIIFTVTSPDDELDLGGLMKDNILDPIPSLKVGDSHVYKVVGTDKHIILPFNGESPNTILEYGIADPIIHQPCAAHIIAALRILQDGFNQYVGVSKINKCDENLVLNIWNGFYQNFPTDNAPIEEEPLILPSRTHSVDSTCMEFRRA